MLSKYIKYWLTPNKLFIHTNDSEEAEIRILKNYPTSSFFGLLFLKILNLCPTVFFKYVKSLGFFQTRLIYFNLAS